MTEVLPPQQLVQREQNPYNKSKAYSGSMEKELALAQEQMDNESRQMQLRIRSLIPVDENVQEAKLEGLESPEGNAYKLTNIIHLLDSNWSNAIATAVLFGSLTLGNGMIIKFMFEDNIKSALFALSVNSVAEAFTAGFLSYKLKKDLRKQRAFFANQVTQPLPTFSPSSHTEE